MTNNNVPRWSVALLGARMYYAIPRILERSGLLNHFYTDLNANQGWIKLLQKVPSSFRPSTLKRLLGRVPPDIPTAKIIAFNHFGLEYTQKLRQAKSSSETTQTFLWAGKKFCKLILDHGINPCHGIYTFNTAGLEILQYAKSQNIITVTEQTIAPKIIEYQLLKAEQERFPDWELPLIFDHSLAKFCQREQAEWEYADLILCGSSFVKDSIIQAGGNGDRCQILPYGVNLSHVEKPVESTDFQTHLKLRVLTIGAVGLRKGSPYVLAAAQQLKHIAEFRMVGSTHLNPNLLSQISEFVNLVGIVPRSEIQEHYQWADVFLLPSICEGSATVTYEALSAGVPVICTPNTGSIVRNGIEGFIIPVHDTEAIIETLELLATDPELLLNLSRNAIDRAQEFTITQYHENLLILLSKLNHG